MRIRPHKIGELAVRLPPDSTAAQILVTGAESHPWTWVTGILNAIDGSPESSYRVAARTLSSAERADALGRSARRWRAVNQQLRSSTLLSAHPEIAAEFLTVTGRTGLTAADIAPAGDDKVRWRCRTCGHEWTARTANRTRLGTGCPPCRYRTGGRKAARPHPGASFADRHPQLVQFFLENLTHPGVGPERLRPNSTDACLWRCPHCGEPWRVSPQGVNRRPNGGCRACWRHRRPTA
jgi:rubrerythrin